MIIGIPKESWHDERRVALTPAGSYALTKLGHRVIVHAEAGIGCGFSAEEYGDAGAVVAFSSEEVFTRADLLVKVMPPTPEECTWIPDQKFLFSTVHMGTANPRVHEALREKKVTAVGLEFIEDAGQTFPVVTAMAEIAGMLLPQIAGRYLETMHGGRGILLGGVAGIPASNVVVIGAGMVGTTAAHSFVGAGANVTVMDADLNRLRRVELVLSKMVNTVLATPYNIERSTRHADVVVGAVMIHRQRAPHVLTEAMVRHMRRGSVILDVSIDQGGCAETSHPTNLSEPVFKKHGVTHYCVPNIPSSVARTASHALNNVMLSFVEDVADKGVEAFSEQQALRRGIYLYDGHCTHEGLAGLLEWECVSTDQVMGSH
jgi:alanine dehydrogenase